MRTDDPRPYAPARLRDEARRAWRWATDRTPRARLALAALALAALAGAGYWVSTSTPEVQTAWLYEGQELTTEEARRVLDALAEAKIPAEPGPRGQVAVPADRRSDALVVLGKKKLGPKTLGAIRDESLSESPFAWPGDRGERADRLRARKAEVLISELEGIESADVFLERAPGRSPGSRAGKVKVLVRLHLRDDQQVSPQSLEAIRFIVGSIEPDLPPDALYVLNRTGRPYLVPGKPDAGVETMAHVREESLAAKIKQRLVWIEGVQVFVTLEVPPAGPNPAATAAPPAPAPEVVLNGPAEVAEPAPEPSPAPAAPEIGKAKILVQVPIAHYLRAYRNMHRREPTQDDLRLYGSVTEDKIRATVETVLPSAEVAALKIDRIDDPGPALPPMAAAGPESSRPSTWWLPAGVAGAVGFLAALLIGTRWLAARRPSATPAAAVPRAHFEVGDDAGPSGRVRELVRRDPAAAAGVLHRWIGQGGHAS